MWDDTVCPECTQEELEHIKETTDTTTDYKAGGLNDRMAKTRRNGQAQPKTKKMHGQNT